MYKKFKISYIINITNNNPLHKRLNMEQIISVFAQVSSISAQINTMSPVEKMKKIEAVISALEDLEMAHQIISDFHSVERQEIFTTVKVLTELDCLSDEVAVKLVERMVSIQNEIEAGIVGKLAGRLPMLRSILGMAEPQTSGLAQLLCSLIR